MADTDLVAFAVWSALTAAVMAASALAYRAYLRRRRHETSPA